MSLSYHCLELSGQCSGAKIWGVNLFEAKLVGAQLIGTQMSGLPCPGPTACPGVNLSRADLAGAFA